MSSYISSSDAGLPPNFPTFVRELAARTWRIGVVLVIAYLAAEIWLLVSPDYRPVDLDTAKVAAQIGRSNRPIEADLLLAGDSSALMGVNPTAIHAFGLKIESLATIGFVGPLGQAAILRSQSKARGDRPIPVVLLMHPASYYSGAIVDEFQTIATVGAIRRPWRPVLAARRKMFDNGFHRLRSWPLPGAYGSFYGWAEDAVIWLDRNAGTLIDPTPPLPECAFSKVGPMRHAIDGRVASELEMLGQAMRELSNGDVLFGVTPVPESRSDSSTRVARAELVNAAAAKLGIPTERILALPPTMPDRLFACSDTHLNAEGREVFSKILTSEVLRLGVTR